MLGPKKSPGRKCERTFFHGVSALSGAKRPERVEFAANSQIGLAFQASEGDNIDAVFSSVCIRTYANLVRQFGVISFGSLAAKLMLIFENSNYMFECLNDLL